MAAAALRGTSRLFTVTPSLGNSCGLLGSLTVIGWLMFVLSSFVLGVLVGFSHKTGSGTGSALSSCPPCPLRCDTEKSTVLASTSLHSEAVPEMPRERLAQSALTEEDRSTSTESNQCTFTSLHEDVRDELMRCRWRALRPPPLIADVNLGGRGVGPDMPPNVAWIFATRGLGRYNYEDMAAHAPRPRNHHVHPYQTPGGEATSHLVHFEHGRPVWTDRLVRRMHAMARRKESLSPHDYPHGAEDVLLAARHFVRTPPAKALVVSAITPWLEVALLEWGVEEVFTVDYNPPVLRQTTKIAAENGDGDGDGDGDGSLMSSMRSLSSRELYKHIGAFELVVSFSGLEHDGLGRYGDPLDPDGDYAGAAEAAAMLAHGGTLLLSVPTGAVDDVEGQGHRIYGPHRFPRLVNATQLQLVGRAWDSRVVLGGLENADEPPQVYADDSQRGENENEPGQIRPTWQYQQVFALRRDDEHHVAGGWKDESCADRV
ncbi:methyltransferase type 11 domain-containing protein [Pseudoscourfieldia marina]